MLTGKIEAIYEDIVTGYTKLQISLQRNKETAEELHKIRTDILYDLPFKQHREKRSLDANAYYWKLVGELAKALKISTTETHNHLLRRYGKPEEIDGQLIYLVLPDTDEAEKMSLNADTYHIKPTSQIKEGKDGNMYRTYIMLRGSSTYNTEEMSCLIDGLASECKEVGIDTITPDEKERMMSAYAVWYQKHNAGR